MSGDAFDDVLPPRRGSNRGRDEVAESRSPLQRARHLVAALTRHSGSLVEAILREHRVAEELGLTLRPGYWTDTDGGQTWALTAVYSGDELVGFSGVSDDTWVLLRCDEPSVHIAVRPAGDA